MVRSSPKKERVIQFAALEPLDEPPSEAKRFFARMHKRLSKLGGQIRERLGDQTETAAACISWASCSIGMTVLNKLAVNKTHAPVAVVIVQMLATSAVAVASRNLKFGEGWKLWAVSVPPLFVLMMVTSMLALQYVTVGTFVVVRNLGPVVTLAVETALHRPDNLSCNPQTTLCLLAIAVGVWMYEAAEVKLSLIGCFYLLANLAFACAERMLQRHLLAVQSIEVSKPALMLLNNGIGAILASLALLVMAPKEWYYLRHSLRHKSGSGLAIFFSCVLGCAISYTGLWLQRLVTATSFMVLGSVSKLVVIISGILFFADASGPLSVLGAGLSVFGGYAYAAGLSFKDCAKKAESCAQGCAVRLGVSEP